LILLVQAWILWQDGKATELVHSSVIEGCPLSTQRLSQKEKRKNGGNV
jgi:hypothetical protein